LSDFLDVSTFPENYNQLRIQHKADYIRLRLLEKYGGTWMDSTIVIQSKPEFDTLYDSVNKSRAELLAFTLHDKEQGHEYHQFIENWFLIAPQNSRTIQLWLEEFTKAIHMGFDNYYHQEAKVNFRPTLKTF